MKKKIVVKRWMDAGKFLERVSEKDLKEDVRYQHHKRFERMMSQRPGR